MDSQITPDMPSCVKQVLDTNRNLPEITKGVIANIGEIFAKNQLSIASVIQKGIDKENTADIIVITEESKEKHIKTAIEELKNNANIVKINSFIRVME